MLISKMALKDNMNFLKRKLGLLWISVHTYQQLYAGTLLCGGNMWMCVHVEGPEAPHLNPELANPAR